MRTKISINIAMGVLLVIVAISAVLFVYGFVLTAGGSALSTRQLAVVIGCAMAILAGAGWSTWRLSQKAG